MPASSDPSAVGAVGVVVAGAVIGGSVTGAGAGGVVATVPPDEPEPPEE